jgi:uncharacterized lipoprotein NlpE involved in copper resistance
MKRTLFLSILIVFFIISLVGCNNQKSTKEQSSVSQNTLKEQSELQKKCGQISKEFFKKNYNSDEHYRNHYNKKLNKCLMVITEKGVIGRKKELFDVYESNTYGIIRINKEKIVMSCDVLKTICKTEQEWDTLVKPYMEE